MNPSLSWYVSFAVMLMSLSAQDLRKETDEDPVAAAIREFEKGKNGEGPDVKVVLPPPDMPAIGDESTEPVLVTGKVAAEADETGTPKPDDSEPEPESSNEPSDVPEPTEAKPPEGLEIRVEKLQTGSGPIDASSVKLRRPFPPKQSSQTPTGWRVEDQPDAIPITKEVSLGNGSTISLSVRPHVLVPEADGDQVFAIQEPGYDPASGYQQNGTISAILDESVKQMDDDARRLGFVIEDLQQLLISLPKPEVEPVPKSVPKR